MLRKSNTSALPLAAQILKETALLSSAILLTTVSVQASELVQKPSSEEEGVDKLDPIVVISDEVDGENATLTTIDSEIVERLQATSVPELLNDTPGVDMNGTARPDGQSLNIWGFGDQEDVRITLDGAQKDFEKYRQGTVFIEPELIKQVYLEKGSFTARTIGAFGGSVKLVTKSASDMLENG
ncbi:MAG: TonB-dependent receptor plug domain-containing protein [Sneathiella sp.]